MEIKQIPSKLFFCAEKALTIPEITVFAEEVLEPLYKEAESLGLEFTGTTELIYLNADGTQTKQFQLIIAVPVKERQPFKSNFFFLEALPFDCATTDYKGPMTDLGKTWDSLVQQALD
jgi:predicted transcriptional regulator YdeE